MKRTRLLGVGHLLLMVVLVTAVSGVLAADTFTHEGTLRRGDSQLTSGEYYDSYTHRARSGDAIVVDLVSQDFDPYLIITGPDGEQYDNDDWEGDWSRSRIEIEDADAGEWIVQVTSYESGETGDYSVDVAIGEGLGTTSDKSGGELLNETGALRNGDELFASGEFVDTFTFTANAGQQLVARMESNEIDTYIVLRSPGGDVWSNDDYDGQTTVSQVEVAADESGMWTVEVTSYAAGETGDYVVTVASDGAVAGGTTSSSTGGDWPGVATGVLEDGDEQLGSGEFTDSFMVTLEAGDYITVDLRSEDFDPYLMMFSPSGEQWDNDDHEGDYSWSQIAMEVPESGEYEVVATTFAPEEEGSYAIELAFDGTGGSSYGASSSSGPRVEEGSLAADDATLDGGQYVDVFEVELRAGQRVAADLASDDFDTYLIVLPPGGQQLENDDSDDDSSHSFLEFETTTAGVFRFGVSSYEIGETGDYTLRVDSSAAGGGVEDQRDIVRIDMGARVSGSLDSGDSTSTSGQYRDFYVFDGSAGDTVTVDMRSSDVDTYLVVQLPSGEELSNDDYEQSLQRSVVELDLRETGRYTVIATSYGDGETGSYSLSLGEGVTGGSYNPPASANGNVRGVFVGISDYPGEYNDLPYTADDAVKARNAFIESVGMEENDGILLTDSQATVSNLKDAIRRAGRGMDSDDILVFFYSGHGSRVDRRGGFQAADPDGIDETLALYDEGITDDEFAELLDEIPNGTVLIILDSCFSGGFSKDVISKPNRMGLFSSHEDVTSAVAAKFQAGGYLAQFLFDAVGDRLADDGDRQLTAMELSQYIYERYRADVKSSSSDFASTGQNLGYQQLIVDRGSITPYQVLFSW